MTPGHVVAIRDLSGRCCYVAWDTEPIVSIQRRINKARSEGKEPREQDCALVAEWFDAREAAEPVAVQLELPFEVAA